MQIDQQVQRAGKIMDLADLPAGATEDEYMELYGGRYHCGVCVTRSVLDVVWPSIEAYIEYLKGRTNERNIG